MTWGSFVGEEAECHRQLQKMWDLGVNFFDTAELYPVGFRKSGRKITDKTDPDYGRVSERWMGNWLGPKLTEKEIRRYVVRINMLCRVLELLNSWTGCLGRGRCHSELRGVGGMDGIASSVPTDSPTPRLSGEDKREDIYLGTKVNPIGIGASEEDGFAGVLHRYEEDVVVSSCRASIERLQCDYIDLYQLHWPIRDLPLFGGISYILPGEHLKGRNMNVGDSSIESRGDVGDTKTAYYPDRAASLDLDLHFEKQVLSVKKLFELKLIRHWGLSNENAFGLTMFCLAADKLGVPRPISLQNDFSLLNRTFEEGGLAEACYRFGVVGLPYGVLAGGLLSGKYRNEPREQRKGSNEKSDVVGRHTALPDYQSRYHYPAARAAAAAYADLAEENGMTPTELALVWARDRWYNGAVIMGCTTVEQVEECVGAFRIKMGDGTNEELEK